MLDTSFLASQVAVNAAQNPQQSLPSQAGDAERFRNLLGGDSSGDIKSGVLQFSDKVQDTKPSGGGLTSQLIEQAVNLDNRYHDMMNAKVPTFGGVDNLNSTQSAQKLRTYPENLDSLSTKDRSLDEVLSDARQSSQESFKNILNFQRDARAWSSKFNTWSNHVQIIAAAAGKVSQGFQTLFRASG